MIMKKNTFCLLMAVLFLFSTASAQVSEGERAMSKGMYNALSINLPNVKDNVVEKMWKKYTKSYKGKTKKVKRKSEWRTEQARVASIGGASAINMHATFEEESDDVNMTVWFEMGEGNYVSSVVYPEQYEGAQQFLNRFALDVRETAIKAEIKEETSRLKKMEASLKKLVKQNKGYHRDIEQAKAKIEKAEANIETNEIEQQETETNIKDQKAAVLLIKKKLEEM